MARSPRPTTADYPELDQATIDRIYEAACAIVWPPLTERQLDLMAQVFAPKTLPAGLRQDAA